METQVVELSQEQFQALVAVMTDWARLQTVLLFFAIFAAVGVFTLASIFRE